MLKPYTSGLYISSALADGAMTVPDLVTRAR